MKISRIGIISLVFSLFLFSCSKKEESGNRKFSPDTLSISKTVKVKKKIEKKKAIDPIDALIDSLMENKKSQRKKIKKVDNFEKGLYLTAYTVANKNFPNILKKIKMAGINTIVFDLKNMNGAIFDFSAKKHVSERFNVIRTLSIKKVVKLVHDENMKAAIRIVMFHDMNIAKKDSLLCPRTTDNNHWIESKLKGPAWLDPSNQKVQNMLLGLISWTADQGVEEIQLDYVRFPTQGNIKDAVFEFQEIDREKSLKDSLYKRRTKSDIIADFIRKASLICHSKNVKLSADIFAITSWQRSMDINATGQDISKMTKYLDKIHPMIYSSHFDKHFDFRENYWNDAYLSVYEGSYRTILYSDKNCSVIPYIQANNWRVRFNKEYIYSQIAATLDSNCRGYLLWNASNNYKDVLDWIKEKPESRL